MQEVLETYRKKAISKISLKEAAECFKGKAVSASESDGNIAVINLRDIEETGLNYSALKALTADPQSLSRYLLKDGDVLVATKGTLKKTAVFAEQKRPVIATANITVLRPKADVLGLYIKLFLDSAIGQALLDEADTGKQVINISREKLLGIEIPHIPLVKQLYLIRRYEQGLQAYKRKISRAAQEWQYLRTNLEKNLF
ncbi:restriction endonuclease subunit S [Streptococcus chenjunshii]|uniref:Restriction endonuclease subunit S n=1 Tax=Streptococcus chenjunshii TaxID=2173853 RepID=A0A372KNW4_9STRE|nr:restriction endonuclease subunit S [Streptococcus chenjunshii]AXQ78747.1 restriction endonuclease subunit S [Streptococcus chenjunshii]RFU51660.1 restriction endonuclease subunit S [Streptococcus chenjunshii]RFU53981.1 restriction endonuclease subunit S [Streptococcus chenjunshii]